MRNVKKHIITPYNAEQMFVLVDDVDTYKDFVPYCSNSEVLSRDDDQVKATIEISAAGFTKAFTTSNRLQRNKMIEIRLVDGPFKHLEGFWLFENLDDNKCKVLLDLEFELAGGLFNMAFDPIFQQVAGLLVEAFSDRAKHVYG